MAAEYAIILQEGSNFRKETAKMCVLPPKFQKVRYEMHKKVNEFFRIRTVTNIFPMNIIIISISSSTDLQAMDNLPHDQVSA